MESVANRRFTFVLGMLLLIPASAFASTQEPTGPLGYWKLDEAATPSLDTAGHAFNGTWTGGGVSAIAPANAGITFTPNPNCAVFNGTSGYITVANNPLLQLTGPFTIAFWMYATTDATASPQALVQKGSTTIRNFGIYRTASATHNIQFQAYSQAGVSVFDVTSAGGLITPLSAWKHVCCTSSGTTATIYIGGVSAGSIAQTGTPGTSTDVLNFGHSSFDSIYYTGRLDDVRIYNRVLSAAEITYLAGNTAAFPGAPTNPAAVGSTGQVNVSWNPPPALAVPASYVVKRSNAPGGPFNMIAMVTGLTAYADAATVPGTTYYYTVAAVTCIGQGVDSTTTTGATPTGAPNVDDGESSSCSCGIPRVEPTGTLAAAAAVLLAALAIARIRA